MLFEEGGHELKNTIVIDNCHNFTMIGNGSVGNLNDGLPQPTSMIYCDKESSAGFFFSDSSNVRIKNLEFKFCSGQNNQYNWHKTLKRIRLSVMEAIVSSSTQDV